MDFSSDGFFTQHVLSQDQLPTLRVRPGIGRDFSWRYGFPPYVSCNGHHVFRRFCPTKSVTGAKPRANLVHIDTVPQSANRKWRNSVPIVPTADVCCTC